MKAIHGLTAAAIALGALAGPGAGIAQSGKPGARAPAPITPSSLLGRWGDNGDCSKDVIFRGDGTFRSYNGGEGRWRLTGNRLVMTGEGGSFTLRVAPIDRDRMRITNADGSTGLSQRCPN
jgi:hypothetical protein